MPDPGNSYNLRSFGLYKLQPETPIYAKDAKLIVDDVISTIIGYKTLVSGIIVPVSKGQIITHNGVAVTLLNVGTNGRILIANSAAPDGIEWVDPSSLGFMTALEVQKAGVVIGSRKILNYLNTGNVTFTVTDNAGNQSVDVEASVTFPTNTSALIIPTITGASVAMTDAATYYWGSSGAFGAVTTQGLARIYNLTGKTLTIVAISTFVRWTVGTSESSTVYLRYNNTTDYSIGTVAGNVAQTELSLTGQSIAWASGDYVEMKMVNPTWVTNPSNMNAGGQIHCLSPVS